MSGIYFLVVQYDSLPSEVVDLQSKTCYLRRRNYTVAHHYSCDDRWKRLLNTYECLEDEDVKLSYKSVEQWIHEITQGRPASIVQHDMIFYHFEGQE